MAKTACGTLLFAVCAALFGSSSVSVDLDLLDRYLDGADRAETEVAWKSLSREGRDAVMAQWESRILTLADAGIDIAQMRAEENQAVEAETEKRLADWLVARFFSDQADLDWDVLLDEVDASKLSGIFELDSLGKARLDASGDPIRKEIADEATFNEEYGKWKASLESLADSAVADWETRASGAMNEFLSEFAGPRRERLEREGNARLASLGAGKRGELYAILALEESDYRYYRLRDQSSLRAESEKVSAESVAAELVEKTRASLDESLEALANGLDAEVGKVTVDGELLDGDAWQEQFRYALEKGLALWERAGEDFLARRIEWEQRAGADLASGIERWNDALRVLQEKESDWLDQFQTVRERAETRFDRRFDELEAARKSALGELDESIAANQGNLNERISVMVDMLDQSLGMLNTARDSAGYWIEKMPSGDSRSMDGASWDANAVRAILLEKLFACAKSASKANGSSSQSVDTETFKGILFAAVKAEVDARLRATGSGEPSKEDLAGMIEDGLSRGILRDVAGYKTLVQEYYRTTAKKSADKAFQTVLAQSIGSLFPSGSLRDNDPYAMIKNSSNSVLLGKVLTAEQAESLRASIIAKVLESTDAMLEGFLSSFDSGIAKDSLDQAHYWIESVYAPYAAEAETQNRELAESYCLVVFEGKDLTGGGYASGQTIAGPIKELLDEYGWEDLYLDDYQVELLKARAVSAYWQKELAIAQAVYDYSVDTDYTRDTEAETLADYSTALAGYNSALASYQEKLQGLDAVNAALDEKNSRLAGIRAKLEEQKKLLSAQKQRYSEILISEKLVNTDYYTGQFRSCYEALAHLRAFDSGEGSIAKAAGTLAASAVAYENDSFLAQSSKALSALISGDSLDDSTVPGIRDLKEQYDARAAFGVNAASFSSESAFLATAARGLAIDETDSRYALLKEAYGAYARTKTESAADTLTSILETLAATLAAESAGTLERRMMDVRVLLSGTAESAYEAAKKVALDSPPASSVEGTRIALAESEEYARRVLLEKRLDVEYAAFDRLIGDIAAYKSADAHDYSVWGFAETKPLSSNDASASLAWTIDRIFGEDRGLEGEALLSFATDCRSALAMLRSILVDAALGSGERNEKLRNLAAENQVVREYLAGNTVLSSGGFDFTLPYIADAYRATVALTGAAKEYSAYALLSPGLRSSYRANAALALSAWLEGNGLGSVDNGEITLKEGETLWNSFAPASRDEALARLAELSRGEQTLLETEGLSPSVANGVSAWFSEVVTLFETRAMQDFGNLPSGTALSLDSEATVKAANLTEFSEASVAFLDGATTPESRSVAVLKLDSLGADITDATREAAIGALATSFCAYRLSLGDTAFGSWESDYAAWFASIGVVDPGNNCRERARTSVVAKAKSLWERARFLKDPDGYDCASSGQKAALEGLRVVLALKDVSPEAYLSAFLKNEDSYAREALALTRLKAYLVSADASAAFDLTASFAGVSFGGDTAAATAYLSGGMSDGNPEKRVPLSLLFSFISFFGDGTFTNREARDSVDGFISSVYSSGDAFGSLVGAAKAGSASDGILSALFYASLYSALDSTECDESERAEALGVMTSATGISADPGLDLLSFSAAGFDARALMGYALNQSAYAYAIKRRILSGDAVSVSLAPLDTDHKEEILRFERVAGAVHGYLATFDGDFRAYLEGSTLASLSDSEKAEAALYWSTGFFGDPYFADEANATGVKGYLDNSLARYAVALTSLAQWDEDALSAQCKTLMEGASVAAFKARIASDCDAIATNSPGAWRANLGVEEFVTDEIDVVRIDDTVLSGKNGTDVYYSLNARVNDGLESAARLNTLAVSLRTFYSAWTSDDFVASDASTAYLAGNNAVLLADPDAHSNPVAHEASQAITLAYQKSRKAYVALIAKQTSLAKALESLGKTVERFKSSEGKSIGEAIASAQKEMAETEKSLGILELEWEKAIDDPSTEDAVARGNFAQGGYSQLEKAYADRYAAAQAAYKTLEETKQESKVAKAIYEYASAPYIQTGSKSNEPGTDSRAKGAAVDPDTRLAEAGDHVKRAAAAVDALEMLYDSSDQKETLYERDATYRSLTDEYERTYRGKLAILQARTLLDTEIASARVSYERDKGAYENAVKNSSSAPTEFASGENTKTVNEWLTELRGAFTSAEMLKIFNSLRISNGVVSFSSDGTYDEQSIADYFTRDSDEAFSEFERDLSEWMIRNRNKDMSQWSQALAWEEYNLTGTYLTYFEYYQNELDKVKEDPGYNGYNLAYFYNNPSAVNNGYGHYLAKAIKSSVLSLYGGTERDEDLAMAIRACCSNEHSEDLIREIRVAYEGSKNDGDYAFFKLLAMYNLFSGESSTTSIAFVDSTFATEFYRLAVEVCQSCGTQSWGEAPSWHNARDEARWKYNYASRVQSEIGGSLMQSQNTIATSKKDYLSSKDALAGLIGGDPESGDQSVSIDQLIDSIVNASERNAAKPLDDILSLAGYAITAGTSDATKRQYLRALLSSGGNGDGSRKRQSVGVYMDEIFGAYGDRVAEAGTEIDEYLYSDGTAQGSAGIAVVQKENERKYLSAYVSFIKGGIIPSGGVTEGTVGKWEDVIASDAINPQTGIALIAEKARAYLESTPEKAGEDSAITALRAAWKFWQKAVSTEIDGESAAQSLRDSFTDVVKGYRAGLDFATSLARAYDRRNESATSPHVFDGREDSIRTCETYMKILGDIQGEESYIRESGREEVIADIHESLMTLNVNRLAAYKQVRESEWDLQRTALEQEKKQFEEQMDAIYSRGRVAWVKSENTLRAAAENWQRDYERKFAQRCDLWNDRYAAFVERKDAWAKNLVTQALCLGDKTILSRIPTITEDAIREATAFFVADVIEAPDPDLLLSGILDEDLLSGLLGSAKQFGNGITGFTPVIFQKLKRTSFTTAEILDRVRRYQTREDDKLQASLSYIQYAKALDTLKEAKIEIAKSIDESNEATWKSFKDLFVDNGFKQTGDNFTKETPIGATFRDNLYETHTIQGYQRFKTEVKDFAKEFASPEGLDYATVGSDGMAALLGKVMDTVPKEYELLYGKYDKEGHSIGAAYERQYMADDTYQDKKWHYDNASKTVVSETIEKTRKISATAASDADAYKAYLKMADELGSSERIVVKNNGIFNEWVGYAPVMKDDADPSLDLEEWQQNVKFDGSGETGRLMGLYIQHKMIEGVGKSEARQPSYNRKLWDDRGSWMAAPTMRTLTDIAMTIAAGVIAPGAGALIMNAALNMIDDAVFTIMDIGNGMDPLAAAEGFMKKAAVSIVASKISAGFSNGAGLLNSTKLGDGVVGQTMTKGLQGMMTNTASSAINSFSVRNFMEGRDSFDENAFGNGVFGKGAMASVAAGMAGTAISTKLDQWDMTDANKDILSHFTFDTENIQRFNGFIGSMAGSAVTYGLTGNAIFNLARFKGVGLMEMNLGKNGFGMNVGMNGTDISLGTLSSAMRGYEEANKVSSWKFGSEEQQKTLNAINLMGWTGALGNAHNVGVSRAIWSEQLKATFKEMPKNENGYYDRDSDSGEIVISSAFLGGGEEAAAKLATVMSHEGSHWSGNRIEGLAQEQGMKTYAQINAMLGLAGDSQFANTMVDAYNDSESWKANEGSREYWRVTKDKDGKVVKVQDDGDKMHFNFVDEEGNSLGSEAITAKRMTAGELSSILKNGQSMEDLSRVMRQSGLSRTEKDGWFAFNGRGVYSTYANSAHPSYQRMIEFEKNRKEEQQRRTPASSKDISDSVTRAKEMLGLPYGSSERDFDSNNVVLKTSKSVDCIGVVSYGTKTPITDTAINFGRNPYFSNTSVFQDPKPSYGDVVQMLYSDSKNDLAHIMIYIGNSGPLRDKSTNKPLSDQVLEACEGQNVRYSTLSHYQQWCKDNNYTLKPYIFYRRNQYTKKE